MIGIVDTASALERAVAAANRLDPSPDAAVLDTLVPGQGGGAVCSKRLQWLDRILSGAQDRPIFGVDASSAISDRNPPDGSGGLAGSAGFAEVIRGHPQIERILCGHLHRPIESRFAGTVAGTAPSTAHQIVLDLRPEARLSFAFEPPGYQLHYWREGIGLVTHTAAIGDWPGPYFYSKKSATD
ncbi:MAG: hypothetical protein WCB44_33340 [Stellaceae bacterium]